MTKADEFVRQRTEAWDVFTRIAHLAVNPNACRHCGETHSQVRTLWGGLCRAAAEDAALERTMLHRSVAKRRVVIGR